jgi:hypothetical protein
MYAAYREYGIRTVPMEGKIPLTKWKSVTLDDHFEEKYPEADIAIVTGDVVTIVDVDEKGLIDFALERFGDTPLQTETPRGGRHLWYRANGEGTTTDVGGLKGIDIRGVGGLAKEPHSKGYSFVRGGIEEIGNLPSINLGSLPQKPAKAVAAMREGDGRNNKLFSEALKLGRGVESEDALLGRVLRLNQEYAEPLPFAEVASVTRSVWKYREEGRLITSERPAIVIYHDEYDRLLHDSDARMLLLDLRRNHGARRGEFALSDATRDRFGKGGRSWTISRLKDAVQTLEAAGLLQITHKGGRKKGDVRRARLL